jgi:hypothetical protein
MKFAQWAAFAAACSMAATPCLAAELTQFNDSGARRSGAGLGAYVSIPLGGARDGRPQAGMRLTVTHDYRNAQAQSAPVVRADTFDLRLIGDRRPTLYVAGQPVTGEQARRNNLTGVGTLVTVAIVAAAVVGGYFIIRAIDDSGEE